MKKEYYSSTTTNNEYSLKANKKMTGKRISLLIMPYKTKAVLPFKDAKKATEFQKLITKAKRIRSNLQIHAKSKQINHKQ